MAKLVLTDLDNLQNETSVVSQVNANNTSIETAMEKTLSRDGTSPNSMTAPLDMNSNRILNLPAANALQEPVRLQEFLDATTGSHTVNLNINPFVNGTQNVDITPVGNPVATKASWYTSGETLYNNTREFENVFTFINSRGSVPITNITKANPAVVTAAGHGFTNGQLVTILGVVGMTQVNNLTFTGTVIDADHFSLGVNSTGYSTYTSGGSATGPGEGHNKVTLYADNVVRAPSGSKPGGGQAWAINTVSTWDSGAPQSSGHGYELDVNVNNAHYDTLNPAVYGLSVTGAGAFRATAAVNISSATGEIWNYGIILTNDAIKQYSFYDTLSNTTMTSIKISGNKLYGIDLSQCNITAGGAGIKLNNQQTITSLNAALNTNINILYLDSSNVCQVGGGSQVNISSLTGLTTSMIVLTGPLQVGSYTVSTLPTAAFNGRIIYVSDETGGKVIAFSDGTNWRRVTDRAIVA